MIAEPQLTSKLFLWPTVRMWNKLQEFRLAVLKINFLTLHSI